METMTNELTVIPGTIGMMGGMGMLKPECNTRSVTLNKIGMLLLLFRYNYCVFDKFRFKHTHSAHHSDCPWTSGITLEELERNCIVPSFSDNQLTISHQTFIHRIEDAARSYFTGENIGNTEIRVSHKILGRVCTSSPFIILLMERI